MIDWVDLDYFDMFYQESSENLSFLEELIENIDESISQSDLDHLFRIFHSLKGIAGMMGFSALSDANHIIENKLKSYCANDPSQTTDLKEWLTESRDYLQDMVQDILKSVESESPEAPDLTHHFEKIKKITIKEENSDESKKNLPDLNNELDQDLKNTIEDYFEQLDNHVERNDVNAVSATFHTLKGDLGIFDKDILVNLIHHLEDYLEDNFEFIVDNYSLVKDAILGNIIEGSDEGINCLNTLLFQKQVKETPSTFINLLQQFISETNQSIKNGKTVDTLINTVNEILLFKDKLSFEDLFAMFDTCSMVGWDSLDDNMFIKDLIKEIKDIITIKIESSEKKQEISKSNALADDFNNKENVNFIQDKEIKGEISKAKSRVVGNKEFFKIDSLYVDQLMDISGEFVVAKNILMHNYKELLQFNREQGKKLEYVIKTISRLSESLQDNVINMRLIPCKDVFKKAPKIVRDISRKLEKKIELKIEGEETQIDKTIGEKVSDALLHIVRNSCDHGIEMPDVRVENQKEEFGTVLIKAGYEQAFLKIEIIDDGAGINTQRVKEKIIEKGVATEEDIKDLSEQDIAYYIFHPGLSTAEVVSDISGRGVGMDVVKSNIEDLGGHVELKTEKNKGSIFTLYIPLSTSVKKSLIAQYDGEKIGVVVEQVVETLKLDATAVFERFGEYFFSYRNSIVKIVNHKFAQGRIPYIIYKVRGHFYAFQVSSFIGHQDLVIKEPSPILKKYQNIMGVSVLGDGSAVLVIDLASYLNQDLNWGGVHAA